MKSGLTFRGGLARVVAFSWMCKAYDLKDWIAFIETYGLPLRLGRYGAEHSAEDVQKLFSAVANIGTDAAAVLPKSMEIEFTETGGGTTADKVFENFARYVDEQISKAVLGQTMTADNGSSKSQAEVHNEVRHDIAAADARALKGTLARDLVKPFVDLNFGVQERYPTLSIDIAEPEDTAMIIDKGLAMARQGVRIKASELRGKLGFAEPDDDDEIVGTGPAPAAEGSRPATNTALNRASNADDLDEIEAGMLDDWDDVMEDVLGPIEAIVAGAATYQELKARLAEAAPQLGASRLIDALVKGMFKARAIGDAGQPGAGDGT
jgi:phage gp29-like protein